MEGESKMPFISIRMFEGRTEEQKSEIEKTFSVEISRILKGEHGPIKIQFEEIPRPEYNK